MLWKIVWKEILSNLKTLRFSVGTILFLILVVLFTSVLISDYRQKLESYNDLVSKNDTELRQLMTYQNLKPTVYKPPEILAVFSKGIIENLGDYVQITVDKVPIPESSIISANPLLSVFPAFDIVLIFKLVMSIFTLLMAYDAISGEKEDKTLALMLSNDIPRHQVLFGKFIGGMITIAVPIAIGFLVVGIMFLVSPMIHLTDTDWFRIVLIFFISLIMVGVLYSFGIFISSVTKQASDSLILLLFVWVLFVLVIPNVSTFMVAHIKPIESREKIDAQVQEIRKVFENRIIEFLRKNPDPETGDHIQSDSTEPWGNYHRFATKSLVRHKQRLYSFIETVLPEYSDKVWWAESNYLISLKNQKNLADMFSRFSPISVYEILISGLSRSDMSGIERFNNQTREYRNQMINYLSGKNAFSSIRYFATVKEEHLFDVKDMEEYDALRNKYGNEKALPLNMEDFPGFHYQPESFADTVRRILPDMALLCIMGILFFLCAFVAFLKYDVR